MEFRYRIDDESRPSFASSNISSTSSSGTYGYFTEQALRAGLLDAGGDFGRMSFMPPLPPMLPLPPMPPMMALQREIEKERIREEVLREIEQRRILEEEVRREIEMEQLIAMRVERSRQRMMLAPLEAEARVKEEINMDPIRPISGATLAEKPLALLAVKQPVSIKPKIEEETQPTLSSQKVEPKNKNSSSFSEVLPLNQKITGTKRKAVPDAGTNKPPRQIPKDWSCALCQVSATSEEGLNEHLQGKRHKAKAAALLVSTTGPKVGGVACGKPKVAATSKQEDGSNTVVKTVNIQLDGKLHKVLDRGGYLWCDLCKVRCNSTIMMASHLGGKKHTAVTGNSEKDHQTKTDDTTNGKPKIKQDEKTLTTESATKDIMEKEDNSGRQDAEKDLVDSANKNYMNEENCEEGNPHQKSQSRS